MATYDGGSFVVEQLESFAEQTRSPDELVVCDDGSHDDTVAQLQRFAARAPFEVRVVPNPQRLGTSANFEKAVSLCTGEIVFLADQDDVWAPAKVERLCGVLEAEPAVGAVFSNGLVANAELRSLRTDLWEAQFFSPREQQQVRDGRAVEVFLKHVVAAGTTLAFRSRFRDLYLPFPNLRDCHDAWIAFVIAAVSEFRILDENLITYRVHGANQFGLHKMSLREQLAQAHKQLEVGAFAYAVDFFTAARERLSGAGDVPSAEPIFSLIDAKIDHSRVRDEMSPHLLGRVPAILREALAGRYGRYSYGLKSVAQDIFLRGL